jgi:hypothetical protein
MTAAITEARGRAVVYARSAGLCECCGSRRAESWSHRVAKARGGLWAPSDGLHLCGDGVRLCHGWLEAHPTWAGEGGWHIRRDPRAPAEVPVYLRPALAWPGWYLIDDEGLYLVVDPDDYGLPEVPEHLPYVVPSGRPLDTVPWVDPR